ncbi:MAG: sialidase family protein [Verrucomicrobiales bacterium]
MNRPLLLALVLSHCPCPRVTAGPATALPPGYSLPTLDLSADSSRQFVVDREPGQYLGHPTTVLLEDGQTILCVYPKGHGAGAIVYKRSADGGRTWGDRLPTPANWSTSHEVPTLHRLVDPDGKRRLVVFSGLYPIRMASSEDDGQHWTPWKNRRFWRHCDDGLRHVIDHRTGALPRAVP